jgi:protein-tyrosine phosphatase
MKKKIIPAALKRDAKCILKNVLNSAVYMIKRNRKEIGGISHILFVCKGNICRSPFAEHLLRSRIENREIIIESAGINVERPTVPPYEAIQAGKRFGVDLSAHRAKSISECCLKTADLIIVMEYNHLLWISAMYHEAMKRTCLLRSFALFPYSYFCNIDDPYGLGQEAFYKCFSLIEKSTTGLKNHLF